ncbi:MAG: 23S rRNA (uridine(2552)-2'-O)-methyltransferase RlmE [Gammaproteobacteria bacterium]|nr:23S rRNA (uridine(2552)-2'-O)-methyltransferase RlmE [Gammaproteobacteria bacterium]
MFMAKRSNSSKRWLDEHNSDYYVKETRKLGYRSRATFKLIEIDAKDKLLRPGITVIDLGAAPGGWSDIASKKIGKKGHVFALDLLPMKPLSGVEFLQGDFREDNVIQTLLTNMAEQKADLVISDMAPNISGNKEVDQPRAMYLAELALDFTQQVLKPNGNFLVKVFQGTGFDQFVVSLRQCFNKVVTRKPQASRPRSREVYLLGLGYHH